MSDEAETVLSVRGEAQRTVEPDRLSLLGSVRVTGETKAEALRQASAAVAALTSDLADLGGVVLATGTMRSPLTWSVDSTSTQPAHELDHATGQYVKTGRVSAIATVTVGVRDMELLDGLTDVLARHEDLQLHDSLWGVDEDNPAWPELRAEAIRAALRKGADYAAALGGRLSRVVHVADVGLLGGGADVGFGRASRLVTPSRSGGGPGDAPALTPVPQLMIAAIDARVLATGVVLDSQA